MSGKKFHQISACIHRQLTVNKNDLSHCPQVNSFSRSDLGIEADVRSRLINMYPINSDRLSVLTLSNFLPRYPVLNTSSWRNYLMTPVSHVNDETLAIVRMLLDSCFLSRQLIWYRFTWPPVRDRPHGTGGIASVLLGVGHLLQITGKHPVLWTFSDSRMLILFLGCLFLICIVRKLHFSIIQFDKRSEYVLHNIFDFRHDSGR